MIAVIPMAGEARRFSEAGFYTPKGLLPLEDGRPVIQRIRQSIGDVETMIISRRQDMKAVHPRCVTPGFDFAVPKMVYLDTSTTGPLDTVYRVRKWLKIDVELVINYCDCWMEYGLEDFLTAMRAAKAQAGMVVFKSDDPRFGRTADGHAIGGVFYFNSAVVFCRKARHIHRWGTPDLGIPSVVMAFQGHQTFLTGAYVDIGTPAAYKVYNAQRTPILSRLDQ